MRAFNFVFTLKKIMDFFLITTCCYIFKYILLCAIYYKASRMRIALLFIVRGFFAVGQFAVRKTVRFDQIRFGFFKVLRRKTYTGLNVE